MKLDKLVGERFKERPANCTFDSHALMIRGGYMKNVANGIYALALPLRRIMRKIEQIVREEMGAIDAQEVLFPMALPASLPQESGRYDKAKDDFVGFNDQSKTPYVLGAAYEEVALQFVREYGQSYAKYPFTLYQFQAKFRDEMTGLVKLREFIAKDAFSFHISQEDLDRYYDRCFRAYERIFTRVGLTGVVPAVSDYDAAGCSLSHQFLLRHPAGEKSIAACSNCDYRSNLEVAENILKVVRDDVSDEMTLVLTPEMKTIDSLSEFLNIPKEKCSKAVVYQRGTDDSYIIVFLRGDLDINEAKLRKYIGCDIYPALITLESGICAGYIGPQNLSEDITVLFDNSIKEGNNLACGANQEEYHYTGVDMRRDVPNAKYHDFSKILEGGICPKCGKKSILFSNGFEVGSIIKQGTKYSEAMKVRYTDQEGNERFPAMGRYGINISRLAVSVCEARYDEYGPVWPMSIAPWQVHICALRFGNQDVAAVSMALYNDLSAAGVEVIFDDRIESAGVMFADADLLGIPVRVIVGPKTVGNGVVEIKARDKSFSETVPTQDAAEYIQSLIKRMSIVNEGSL
ncbi:MAG: proline--tRNA ligase [Defluviitaleaceae bacterium]|nr:proline--tRNA ligase [Defluviitaleaceae bacterium]